MKSGNGQIISGTSICVDYWNWSPDQKYIHFLSHLHADHTYKLTSTFRERIHTSKFNAWLVQKWFNIQPDLVVALDVGSTYVLLDNITNNYINVTLLDANHCPGSVMFLFQGYFGRILYTGDFRYCPSMLKQPMLKSLIENENLDRLYVDNTFAAEHCEFPPRREALQDVLTLIRNHPDHYILIGLRKLGKEEVLQEIALDLKEKILVSQEKLEILKYLHFKNVFTTDPRQSRILVMNMHQINSSYIQKLKEDKGPVLTILLTALYSVLPRTEKYSKVKEDKELGIHRIPYSDHSCHSELAEFVSKVKPSTIHPVVKVTVPNKQASTEIDEYSLDLLPMSCTWRNSVIPQSILQLCRYPQACAERNGEMSRFVNNVVVNSEIVPYQMTEDESKSSVSGPSQQENVSHANNLIDANSMEIFHDFQDLCESEVPGSEEWFRMSDEEITQKSTVSNNVTLPQAPSSYEKEAVFGLTNQVDFANMPELRLSPLTHSCTIIDDKTTNQQQLIPISRTEVSPNIIREESSLLDYTSNCLTSQPGQHSELELRNSTNARDENNTVLEFQEKHNTEKSCTEQCLPSEERRSNPQNTLEALLFPTPIQSLSNTSPIIDKDTDIESGQNHVIADCSENVLPEIQHSPDFIDLSMISNIEYLMPEFNSKSNENYQTKDVIPVLTNSKNTSLKQLLFRTPPSGNKIASFQKPPPTPKPTHMTETEAEDEGTMISYISNKTMINDISNESMINDISNDSLQCQTTVCPLRPELNEKVNTCGKIRQTKTNSTLKYSGKKKLRISEQFKHLLVTSQIYLNSDSFCEAIATSRNECRQRSSSVENDRLTGEESGYEVDVNDVFYTNLDFAVSSWKESVRSQCSKSSLNVDINCSSPSEDQNQIWDGYDWKAIFERDRCDFE